MKKKKNNFLRNLIFTIICGFNLISLCGAWTIDNNGNLVSDNLCETNMAEYGNQYVYFANKCNLKPNTTYTLTLGSSLGGGYRVTVAKNTWDESIVLLNNYADDLTRTFTTPSNVEESNEWIIAFRGTFTETTNKTLMLNLGSTALPYEPYFIWYSQSNYENLQNEITQLNSEIENLEEQINDLQNEYDTLLNNIGTISFDISQYSVSVGSVPNPPSFTYTKHQDLNNNFSTIGYLNISDIYTNYIQNGNNNSIYITTPQSNLLTFDLIFNYINAPSTMLKTTLYLPNGNTQQFSYSVDNFQYNEDWTLANLVGSTSIGANYNLNEISYKDLLITYETGHNTLSEIKIGSNNGFNIGFNSGYNTALDRINELTIEINTKTSLLEKANVDLQNKTNEYNMLLARYQQVTETPIQLNFQNLIWTIASSPFESFKQIWNVDILGFNIANFVIGVMSVFVVMYIIKKIF